MNPTSQALQKFLSGIGGGVKSYIQNNQFPTPPAQVPGQSIGETYRNSDFGKRSTQMALGLSQNVASAAPVSVAGKALSKIVNIPTDDVQALSRGYDYLKKAPLYEQQTKWGGQIMDEFHNTADNYLKKLGFKAKDIKFMSEDQKWQTLLPDMHKSIDLRVNK